MLNSPAYWELLRALVLAVGLRGMYEATRPAPQGDPSREPQKALKNDLTYSKTQSTIRARPQIMRSEALSKQADRYIRRWVEGLSR